MSFKIFTDCSANLPGYLLRDLDITVIPCTYMVDGEIAAYDGNLDNFDYKAYYDSLRAGKLVTTSLLNSAVYVENFTPTLEEGFDIVYVSLSSGVSGTYNASTIAARELMEQFPERTVRTVDSRGAGLGVGALTCLAADLRNEGLSVNEAADKLERAADHLCQYFTVDDLMFLRRTGRISTTVAAVGTLLGIKPLLWGNERGEIVDIAKLRGRRRAIDAIMRKYAEKVRDADKQRIFISHGDCIEDAEEIARRVREISEPRELIICPHEPFTGSHVGPGMLALFFFGTER